MPDEPQIDQLFSILDHFTVGELGVDFDPNLVCEIPVQTAVDEAEECGAVICTIERHDSLLVLAAVALHHVKENHA